MPSRAKAAHYVLGATSDADASKQPLILADRLEPQADWMLGPAGLPPIWPGLLAAAFALVSGIWLLVLVWPQPRQPAFLPVDVHPAQAHEVARNLPFAPTQASSIGAAEGPELSIWALDMARYGPPRALGNNDAIDAKQPLSIVMRAPSAKAEQATWAGLFVMDGHNAPVALWPNAPTPNGTSQLLQQGKLARGQGIVLPIDVPKMLSGHSQLRFIAVASPEPLAAEQLSQLLDHHAPLDFLTASWSGSRNSHATSQRAASATKVTRVDLHIRR